MEESIVDKINFFEIVYTPETGGMPAFYGGMSEMLVCTFRDEAELRKIWDKYMSDRLVVAYDIFAVSSENLGEDHLSVYCIELQSSF